MEIQVQTQVHCTDGVCGRSEYVLIDPVQDQVTHVVVRDDAAPHTEYVVPVDLLTESDEHTIHLRISQEDLRKLDPFIKTEVVEEKMPTMYAGRLGSPAGYGMGTFYYLPYVVPEGTMRLPVEHLQVPPGELAVRRGLRVQATDGEVGRVDEFMVDSESGCITHLVMHEGHLWGHRDVLIPLSAIDEIRDESVCLKLDKQQVEALPTFPVRRHWA